MSAWRWKSPHMIHHGEDWIVTSDPDLAKAVEDQGWLIEEFVPPPQPWHETSLI